MSGWKRAASASASRAFQPAVSASTSALICSSAVLIKEAYCNRSIGREILGVGSRSQTGHDRSQVLSSQFAQKQALAATANSRTAHALKAGLRSILFTSSRCATPSLSGARTFRGAVFVANQDRATSWPFL